MLTAGAVAVLFLAWFQESRVVDRVPEGMTVVAGSLRFSADGTKVAYVAKKGDARHPVIGHTVGKAYKDVDPPVIDASGAHVAFRAFEQKRTGDISCAVLYDGKEFATAEWIGRIALAPTDGTPAFWTALGHATEADGSYAWGPMVLFFGKKKSGKWQTADEVLPPMFAADGQHVFSVGTKDEDWGIVWLDRKGNEEKRMGGHIVEVWPNPNGLGMVCTTLAGDPKKDDPHQFFIRQLSLTDDDSVLAFGKSYDSAGNPVYSRDGAHLAFKALSGDKMGVSVDGKDPTGTFDYVDELTFDPDGNQIAYVAANGCELDQDLGWQVLADMVEVKGGRWCVVTGSTPSESYDRTRLPTWSPDGSKLAFAARKDGSWRVIVGKSSTSGYDEIARIEWEPAGGSVWYGARHGQELWWSKAAVE